MDREVNLDESLQQRLSRRDLFRNAGVAGIEPLRPPGFGLAASDLGRSSPGAPSAHAQDRGATYREAGGTNHRHGSGQVPKTFKEAPQLAELVKAGKLPSVKERSGEDPLVIKPVHEIGRYGGTIRRGSTGLGDWSAGVRFCGNDSLVHWDMTGTKPTPLAKLDPSTLRK